MGINISIIYILINYLIDKKISYNFYKYHYVNCKLILSLSLLTNTIVLILFIRQFSIII